MAEPQLERTDPMPTECGRLPQDLWDKVVADASLFLADDTSDKSEVDFEETDYDVAEDGLSDGDDS